MCYIIQEEPSLFIQQKYMQEWDFDHSQPSLKLPSTSLFAVQEHYGLSSEPNATSGLSTFRGLNIADPHHLVSFGGARGVVVIVVGNGHGDTSSNPGSRLIAFHIALIPLGKV